MPIPGLAQDSGDAAHGVVYQEPSEDVADISVFHEPLAPLWHVDSGASIRPGVDSA
jgi:hypothetical protein